MRNLFNILVTGGAASANLNASILSADPSAADAITWALAQAGSGAILQGCNKMPAPMDLTEITVTLPSIAAAHGTAITPAGATVSGGYGPYTYAAFGLPPGLAINTSTGQISGTPTTAGTYAYAVVTTDSNGDVGVATGSITVS